MDLSLKEAALADLVVIVLLLVVVFGGSLGIVVIVDKYPFVP